MVQENTFHPTLVHVIETDDHGRAVAAKAKIDPGRDVFREEALLILPRRGSSAVDQSGDLPEILSKFDPQMWSDWWMYTQQPKEVQAKILNLYKDMECPHAKCLIQYLADQSHRLAQQPNRESFDGYILDRPNEFVQFQMVMRFNSVELRPPAADGQGPGQDFGSGLFEVACKINHSCAPNCAWHTSMDGQSKVVRAISPIAPGEELTLDYINCELDSIHHRQKDLLTYKGFVCDCPRCAAANPRDDTRRYKCVHSVTHKCPGVHFLLPPDPACLLETSKDAETPPRMSVCSVCGSVAPSTYIQEMMHLEKRLDQEMSDLESMSREDLMNQHDRIVQLHPPHEGHGLADRCLELQAAHYCRLDDYESAASCVARQVTCRKQILGCVPNESIAFLWERLGDLCTHFDWSLAAVAYQQSVQHLKIMRGDPTDPYLVCAEQKLLQVQQQVQSSPPSSPLLPEDREDTEQERTCNFCGTSGIRFVSECTSHMDYYYYCCLSHAQLHWKVLHRLPTTTAAKEQYSMSNLLTGSVHVVPNDSDVEEANEGEYRD